MTAVLTASPIALANVVAARSGRPHWVVLGLSALLGVTSGLAINMHNSCSEYPEGSVARVNIIFGIMVTALVVAVLMALYALSPPFVHAFQSANAANNKTVIATTSTGGVATAVPVTITTVPAA